MIQGKKAPSATVEVIHQLDVSKMVANEKAGAFSTAIDPALLKMDSELIESYGIPLIWDICKNEMQTQLRLMGISGESQMRWYRIESQLIQWLRLIYTDMTEEQIVEKWGKPEDADGRSELELDAKTKPFK